MKLLGDPKPDKTGHQPNARSPHVDCLPPSGRCCARGSRSQRRRAHLPSPPALPTRPSAGKPAAHGRPDFVSEDTGVGNRHALLSNGSGQGKSVPLHPTSFPLRPSPSLFPLPSHARPRPPALPSPPFPLPPSLPRSLSPLKSPHLSHLPPTPFPPDSRGRQPSPHKPSHGPLQLLPRAQRPAQPSWPEAPSPCRHPRRGPLREPSEIRAPERTHVAPCLISFLALPDPNLRHHPDPHSPPRLISPHIVASRSRGSAPEALVKVPGFTTRQRAAR